jgi:hypothetical protein
VLTVVLTVFLVLVPSISRAHHSPAMFDMQKRVTLTGTVRDFQWTNPHSYIQLMVKDKTGREVEWSLEMAAPTYLYNNGWRPSTLKRGDTIVATIAPLAKGTPGGLVISVTTTDGRKLGGGKP